MIRVWLQDRSFKDLVIRGLYRYSDSGWDDDRQKKTFPSEVDDWRGLVL